MDKDWKPEHKPASAPVKRTEKENDEEIAEIAEEEFSDKKASKHQDLFANSKSANRNSGIWKILVGIVIIGLLAIFFIVPALKGYGVYKAMKASGVPETYTTDMASLQKAKTDAEEASQNAAQTVTACQAAQEAADQVAKDAESKAQTFSAAADQMQQERDTCLEEIETVQQALADAANRLCCISRFTNSAINAYVIADNSVACVSEGGTAINC